MSFSSGQLAAVKTAVTKMPLAQLTDMIQLNQPPGAAGTVTVDGSGNITVGGVPFSNTNYQLLGLALGIC